MGKEVKRAVILGVIILLAAVIINIDEDKGLSGNAISRTTRQVQNPQPISQQTPVKQPFCGATDITEKILAKISGIPKLVDIINVDFSHRTFVIVINQQQGRTWNGTIGNSPNDDWYIYDTGPDGIIGDNDAVYFGGSGPQYSITNSNYQFITDINGNEQRLFWINRGSIESCDTPQCQNRRIEVVLPVQSAIDAYLPALRKERIYMVTRIPNFQGNLALISCSMRLGSIDWCGDSSAPQNFRIDIANLGSSLPRSLIDLGFIILSQSLPRTEQFFSIDQDLLVPWENIYENTAAPIGNGIGFALKGIGGSRWNPENIELELIDFGAGTILKSRESILAQQRRPELFFFTPTSQGTIPTALFTRISNGARIYEIKKYTQPSQSIKTVYEFTPPTGAGYYDYNKNLATHAGQILLFGTNTKIYQLECTP